MFMGFLATRQLMKMKVEDTITWLSENQVILNSDESKVTVISKKKSDQGKRNESK